MIRKVPLGRPFSTRQKFELAKPTFLENWPDALKQMSLRQVEVPLTPHQARALGSNIRGFEKCFYDQVRLVIDDIEIKLLEALKAFPQGCFLRLGSRSGKDSDFALASGMKVQSLRSALAMLTDGSKRIASDLLASLNFHYAPSIFLREWRVAGKVA
jgi:hypothetical protein